MLSEIKYGTYVQNMPYHEAERGGRGNPESLCNQTNKNQPYTYMSHIIVKNVNNMKRDFFEKSLKIIVACK